MENLEVTFNLNDTDNLLAQVEEELSELRSYVDDYLTDCGTLPPILNNYTVMRVLEMINALKDINSRFNYVEQKREEYRRRQDGRI